MKNARSQGEVRPEPQSAEGLQPVSLLAYKTFRTAGDAGNSSRTSFSSYEHREDKR